MAPRILSGLAILVAFVAVLLGVLSRTRVSGTIPLVHLGIPWGITLDKVPDLTGKYCIVTGASSGIGEGISLQLAKKGANVILVCRSMTDCNKSAGQAKAVAKDAGNQIIRAMYADLNSLESVENFVNEYRATNMPIHYLFLNAGVMFPEFGLTKEGIETQFGVNHVAHQAMTLALLDIVKKTSETSLVSIVSVSSIGHYLTIPEGVRLDPAQISDPALYDRFGYYGQSKLANILMAKQLAKILEKQGYSQIRVQAVHPGGVQGKLNRHILSGPLKIIDDIQQSLLYWTIEDGSLTCIGAAVRTDVPSGSYFIPIARVAETSSQGSDPVLAEKVWDMTQNLIQKVRPSLARSP